MQPVTPCVETLESRLLLSATYTIHDTGLSSDAADSNALATMLNGADTTVRINNQSDIIGVSGGLAAALVPATPFPTVLDLGAIPGDSVGWGQALNNTGEFLAASDGGLLFPTSNDPRGFLTSSGGSGAEAIVLVPGSTASIGYAINDSGTSVGAATSGAAGAPAIKAFVATTRSGVATESVLPDLLNDIRQEGTSIAFAINASGTIVGTSPAGLQRSPSADSSQATLWTSSARGYTAVPLLANVRGITTSAALAINDTGMIGGQYNAIISRTIVTHPFLLTAPGHRTPGTFMPIRTLHGYTNGTVLSMNSSGVAVGEDYVTTRTGRTFERAFMFTPNSRGRGTLIDLNALLPTRSGWVLQQATSINDEGQIVGDGTLNGVAAVFLLDPPAATITIARPAADAFVAIPDTTIGAVANGNAAAQKNIFSNSSIDLLD